MSVNSIFLMGNLTRDPEIRYTTGGAAVCNFGMAINSSYATANGEMREEVCFVDVEAWGKQAEAMQRYKRKGDQVFIEGRLKMESWQDKQSGQNRTKLNIRAERIQFIGNKEQEPTNANKPQTPVNPSRVPAPVIQERRAPIAPFVANPKAPAFRAGSIADEDVPSYKSPHGGGNPEEDNIPF